ncbi:MAG: hypothetical protein LBH19_06300 [Dysgonamonadaceae bacterium]|nr:hypothetical protein [Dysgonamonadaceae bacterium]
MMSKRATRRFRFTVIVPSSAGFRTEIHPSGVPAPLLLIDIGRGVVSSRRSLSLTNSESDSNSLNSSSVVTPACTEMSGSEVIMSGPLTLATIKNLEAKLSLSPTKMLAHVVFPELVKSRGSCGSPCCGVVIPEKVAPSPQPKRL